MRISKKLTLIWIVLMFVITFICSLTYLVTQQSLRLGANDVPAQLATDTALKLQAGVNAKSVVPEYKIDISKSLSPFVIVYDENKKLLMTSAMLGSKDPSYPKGVFDSVDKNGQIRLTWQPQDELRFATVVVKYDHGYIVAGRSLHETEGIIDTIGRIVLYAWIVCFICSILALALIQLFVKKINKFEQT